MINYAIFDFILDWLFYFIPHGYCHIGGLYVINWSSNKFYHCKDFYNTETNSPYCNNWEIHFGNVDIIPSLFDNHHYLTRRQKPMERCQENAKMKFLNEFI